MLAVIKRAHDQHSMSWDGYRGHHKIDMFSTQCWPEISSYLHEIKQCLEQLYHDIDPCLQEWLSQCKVFPAINLQYFPPDHHYRDWHWERIDHLPLRAWTFMTYLNDIPGPGGETEFLFQDIRIKPRSGLTLIWPADFTHTHRGIVSTDPKYIITGWLEMPNSTQGKSITDLIKLCQRQIRS